jgi:hypothetical protein
MALQSFQLQLIRINDTREDRQNFTYYPLLADLGLVWQLPWTNDCLIIYIEKTLSSRKSFSTATTEVAKEKENLGGEVVQLISPPLPHRFEIQVNLGFLSPSIITSAAISSFITTSGLHCWLQHPSTQPLPLASSIHQPQPFPTTSNHHYLDLQPPLPRPLRLQPYLNRPIIATSTVT